MVICVLYKTLLLRKKSPTIYLKDDAKISGIKQIVRWLVAHIWACLKVLSGCFSVSSLRNFRPQKLNQL